MISDWVKIDLNYIRPNSYFVFNIYSKDGEKILEPRIPLTFDKIQNIYKKFGNYVYYDLNDVEYTIPKKEMDIAYDVSRSIMDEISITDQLSKETYKEAEQMTEVLVGILNKTDIKVINLLKELKSYEEYTYQHSVNVGILSAVFAQKLDYLTIDELKHLTLGAFLHDIGKIKIEKEILNKKGKLNQLETIKIRRHPQLGYEMVKRLGKSHPIVQQTILFHHEKYNDKGYYGLPYENLPIYPKITSICDIFDALTTHRPYRNALNSAEALKSIVNSINLHFDYSFVSNFINYMESILNNCQSIYKINDICELNSQELALIKELGSKNLMRPKILVFCKFSRIGRKINAKFYKKPFSLDLQRDSSRKIAKIINNQQHINVIKARLRERCILVE
ncbi:MAG: HD domain-containing protein [Spirochaetota bacterium]|nr:HD domain-containing protein [Spirochaetota bacterium]